MKHLLPALLAGLCALAPQDPAPLPQAEARKLRAAFAEALAEPGERSRAALFALGKKLAAKHSHAELVAALREGPLLEPSSTKPRKRKKELEKLASFGTTTVGYTFECEEGVFRYAVDVPAAYDPKEPAAVLLDPGHGSGAGKSDEDKAGFLGYYRRQCEQAGLADWLVVRTEIVEQVGAGGLRGALPDDRVAATFDGLWRDLASRFRVDPDRLYVAGLSQTGYWAWYLARARADRLAGIAPMSAVTWQVDAYLPCLARLPAYVLHGDQDPACPVAQPRATCAKLAELGAPVKYVEVAGGAHDFAVWGKLHEGLRWLAERPRAAFPREVSKSFGTLADPWCHWLRVEALESENDGKATSRPCATIEGAIEGQRVRLTSTGVLRVRLYLARELVDFEQPVEVLWNGETVFTGKLGTEFALTLETALEKCDWKQTFDWSRVLKRP